MTKLIRSTTKVNNARELKVFMKNRMWKDYKYVMIAVIMVIIAIFSSAIIQYSTSKDHIYRIDMQNADLLERVFRSGEPWTILCSSPDALMPPVFNKLPKRLKGKSFVGVLDCSLPLPASGKSVYIRFNIKPSISPTIFTVANGEKPKQIFLNYLQSTKALAKRVIEQTQKTAKEIRNSAQLEVNCLQRRNCILLLRGAKWKPYEKQWIQQLYASYRKLSFAWVDSTMLKLSIESMLPEFIAGEHRLILFKKSTEKPSTVTAKAFRNIFDRLPVSQFIDENLDAPLKPISKPITLHRRENASQTTSQSTTSQRRSESGRKENVASEGHVSEDAVDEVKFTETTFTGSLGEEIEEVIDLDDEVIDLDL